MLIVCYGDEHGMLKAYSFYSREYAERFYREILDNEFRTFGPWIVEEG